MTSVSTHLMFQDGNAREASAWYVSLVPRSRIERTVDDGPGGVRVDFTLAGQPFIAFDSPIRHAFDFTPSMSVFVSCDTEDEVRTLFGQLAAGGEVKMPVDDYGFSSCFGWTCDRYGVSWQVGLFDREPVGA